VSACVKTMNLGLGASFLLVSNASSLASNGGSSRCRSKAAGRWPAGTRPAEIPLTKWSLQPNEAVQTRTRHMYQVTRPARFGLGRPAGKVADEMNILQCLDIFHSAANDMQNKPFLFMKNES
jgi:hypothetical protein